MSLNLDGSLTVTVAVNVPVVSYITVDLLIMPPDVRLVSGQFRNDKLHITKYLEYKDLCNPSVVPILQILVPDKSIRIADSEGFKWKVFMLSTDKRTLYKADPRRADLVAVLNPPIIAEDGTPMEKCIISHTDGAFCDFLPVYQLERIPNSSWIARAAKKKVQKWIKNEFTFLQTTAQ